MTDGIVIARWKEHPYTSYDRRSNTIHYRVVLNHYDGVGADVRVEARSPETGDLPDDWAELDVWELREHGLRHVSGKIDPLRERHK